MNPVIATHGLTKRFGGKTVVDRLDLAVPAGAVFALLGDNGAGKSTTIRMLTGLLPPDAGRAEILGQDCWAAAPALRHRVGYVPEKPRFYDWMTVREIGWFTSGFHAPRLPAALPRAGRALPPRPGRPAQEPLQGRLRQGRPGPGPRLRPGSADPRRADLRPRPVHSPRVPVQHGRPRRRRPHHPHLQPRRRRGGARRQPRRLPRRGPAAAGRPAGRAAPPHRPRPAALRDDAAGRRRAGPGAGQRRSPAGSGRRSCSTPTAPPWTPCGERADLEGVEESPLTLEEMYTALLARYHTGGPLTASANGRATARRAGLEGFRRREAGHDRRACLEGIPGTADRLGGAGRSSARRRCSACPVLHGRRGGSRPTAHRRLDCTRRSSSSPGRYGLICGAMLLAGEREMGTLPFLDALPGLRRQLWRAKCLAGVLLVIAQVAVLMGLARPAAVRRVDRGGGGPARHAGRRACSAWPGGCCSRRSAAAS